MINFKHTDKSKGVPYRNAFCVYKVSKGACAAMHERLFVIATTANQLVKLAKRVLSLLFVD